MKSYTYAFAIMFLLVPGICMAKERFGSFSYNAMESGPRKAFYEKDRNLPNSYSRVPEAPFGTDSSSPVHRFEIRPGECGGGDCSSRAMRSELAENNHRGTKFGRIQPKSAWYEWEVGFSDEFLAGPDQSGGGYYLLGQFHNSQCPHANLGLWNGRKAGQNARINGSDSSYMLHLRVNRLVPGHRHGDCQPEHLIPVVDLRQIQNQWTHIVMFIKWSPNEDGEIQVFVNGEQVVQFNGRTLIPELQGKNHFDFGVYLANTDNLRRVQRSTLYYRNIRRSRGKPSM